MDAKSKRDKVLERFAGEAGMSYADAITLRALAADAFDAGVAECNEDRPGVVELSRVTGDAVERFARARGLATEWPGLWPCFLKSGRRVFLPSGETEE